MTHNDLIKDQFSRQAIPFSKAPAMQDRAAIEHLMKAANAQPGQRSLDVACGPGLVVLAFAGIVDTAIGFDTTPAMLDRARTLQLQQGQQNVQWQLGDAEYLPFESASFDIVTCRFAFHHFKQPNRVLAEMIRVAKPGARVVVCDGVASDDPQKAAALNRMERLRDPSTVHFHTLTELRGLFLSAGLSILTEHYYRVPIELEGLMAASFPAAGDAAKVRHMIETSIADDNLGMGTRVREGKFLLHYPAVILVAEAD